MSCVLVLYFIFNVMVFINKGVQWWPVLLLYTVYIKKCVVSWEIAMFCTLWYLLFQIAATKAFFKGTVYELLRLVEYDLRFSRKILKICFGFMQNIPQCPWSRTYLNSQCCPVKELLVNISSFRWYLFYKIMIFSSLYEINGGFI